MSETPLDSLYGKGASSAFQKATGGSVTEVSIKDGVRVYVGWDDGSVLKIDCFPRYVHYLTLKSYRKGLYTDLCGTLPDLFKQRGVESFTASPADVESDAILRRRGNWQDAERGIRWVL